MVTLNKGILCGINSHNNCGTPTCKCSCHNEIKNYEYSSYNHFIYALAYDILMSFGIEQNDDLSAYLDAAIEIYGYENITEEVYNKSLDALKYTLDNRDKSFSLYEIDGLLNI